MNIIEYNPIDAATFMKPEENVVDKFMAYLEKNRVNARFDAAADAILMRPADSWRIKGNYCSNRLASAGTFIVSRSLQTVKTRAGHLHLPKTKFTFIPSPIPLIFPC